MIGLDTNVVSEILRPNPSAKVLEWLLGQASHDLFITSITEAELLYGVAVLPIGRRRRHLEALILPVLDEDFAGRILPFDSAAAREYAHIAATRRQIGRPISEADARIAAIARSRDIGIATRNLADFVDCGIELIDPWT